MVYCNFGEGSSKSGLPGLIACIPALAIVLITLSGSPAAAGIVVSLADPNPVFMVPASGTTTGFLDGTITLDPRFIPASLILGSAPYDHATQSVYLTTNFAADVEAWFMARQPGVAFTGHLLAFTIDASAPLGLYDSKAGGPGPIRFGAQETAGQTLTPDPAFAPFTVTLIASTPEPASLVLLGMGIAALGLLRWRGQERDR